MRQDRGPRTARGLTREQILAGRRKGWEERFWERTIPEPNTGCLLWLGSPTDEGYGQLKVGTKPHRVGLLAHRVAFVLAGGVLQDGDDLLHSCNNSACCERRHMRAGSQAENNADMKRAGLYPAICAAMRAHLPSNPQPTEVAA